MDKKTYEQNPRAYAIEMVEQGLVRAENMMLCLLSYMSHDDVREALDANELSPRFNEDEGE